MAERHEVTVTGRNASVLSQLQLQGARTTTWDMLTQKEKAKWPVEVKDEFDVVILNAGVGYFKEHTALSPEEIHEMLTVNVELPMLLSRYHSKLFQQRGMGQLVFIGSLAGRMASPKASVYAATKHALTGYVQGLRMELMGSGVDVTIVQPGPIDTPFIDKADESGSYKKSLGKHLLSIETVRDVVLEQLVRPQGEVLVPRHLGIGAKLTQLVPLQFERFGRSIYAKK